MQMTCGGFGRLQTMENSEATIIPKIRSSEHPGIDARIFINMMRNQPLDDKVTGSHERS